MALKVPLMLICSFVAEEGEQFGQIRDWSTLLDDTIVTLSLDQLRQVCHTNILFFFWASEILDIGLTFLFYSRPGTA